MARPLRGSCDGSAVAVEERPGCSLIHAYNLKTQSGDSALAGVSDAGILYGSVGASHINQLFGATTELCREIADADGELNLQKCALVEPAMAEACSKGLRWEVLSWRIEEEEGGIASVQAGLNDRAAAQMMQHEMENIKQLA